MSAVNAVIAITSEHQAFALKSTLFVMNMINLLDNASLASQASFLPMELAASQQPLYPIKIAKLGTEPSVFNVPSEHTSQKMEPAKSPIPFADHST